MHLLSRLEIALFAIVLLLVYIVPYTKVEESFTLHAIKDILELGTHNDVLSKYDHKEFPGAVPRSFIGPWLLASLLPLRLKSAWTNQLEIQTLIRWTLSMLSCASLTFLTRRLKRVFGAKVSQHTLTLCMTQFHLIFWMGRTIPNMLAFPIGKKALLVSTWAILTGYLQLNFTVIVQVALGCIIAPITLKTTSNRSGQRSFYSILLGLCMILSTAVILRMELLAFLLPLALDNVLRGFISIHDAKAWLAGIAVALISLGLTGYVDSYFWGVGRKELGGLFWPEGEAMWFNIFQGKSQEWGISPWHFYFTRSIPLIFHFSTPLILLSLLIDRRCRQIGLPSLLCIAFLSCLGHKEWRFWVYSIPALNCCAAAGIQSLQPLYSKRIKRVVLAVVIGTNIIVSSFGVLASMQNYPGGDAMKYLGSLSPAISSSVKIHIDSHSAMTGASKFTHINEYPAPTYISSCVSSLKPSKFYSKSRSSPEEECILSDLSSRFPIFSSIVSLTYQGNSGSMEYTHQQAKAYGRGRLVDKENAWNYSRSESLISLLEFEDFDYLITGHPDLFTGEGIFELAKSFQEFDGFKIPRRIGDLKNMVNRFGLIDTKVKDSVWLLRNKRKRQM